MDFINVHDVYREKKTNTDRVTLTLKVEITI